MKEPKLFLKIKKDKFNTIYIPHLENEKFIQLFYGGASSGKSKFLAQRDIKKVLLGRNILCVRNTKISLKHSVFNELKKVIHEWKIKKYFNINKSELIITCLLNGSQILFAGLDDTEKLKSITPAKGILTDIRIEEATECGEKDVKQLEKRLRGESEFKKTLTMSFNPILKTHWIYKKYFEKNWKDSKNYFESKNLSILKTTFRDNRFLTKEDKERLLEETDKYFHDVYTEGMWGVLGGIIFTNWEIKEFDQDQFDKYFYGIDWGFSIDPFVFIQLHRDKKNKIIYFCREVASTNLSNEQAADLVRPIIGEGYNRADNEDPKSITEFNRLKVRTVAAKKGKGSVEYGIKFIKSHKVIIHPSCQEAINNFSQYKYKEDKHGNVLPVPVDKFNHCIDAARYALEDAEKREPVFVVA